MIYIYFCLLSTVLLASCSDELGGTFEVMNNSGKSIRQLSIDICNQHFEYISFDNEKSLLQSFKLNCEGSYLVVAKLSDGSILKGKVGYVTVSIDSAQKIFINAGNVSLSEQ